MTRKLIYSMMVSIDGYIEDQNGGIDWSTPGPELNDHFSKADTTIDTHFYGRKLYENMAAFWNNADERPESTDFEREYSRIWKETKKIVFSKTLQDVHTINTVLVSHDIEETVQAYKNEEGKDIDVGGAGLANTLVKLNLIDEYRLYVLPTVLAGGKPMFKIPASFMLEETITFDGNVVLLRYVPVS